MCSPARCGRCGKTPGAMRPARRLVMSRVAPEQRCTCSPIERPVRRSVEQSLKHCREPPANSGEANSRKRPPRPRGCASVGEVRAPPGSLGGRSSSLMRRPATAGHSVAVT